MTRAPARHPLTGCRRRGPKRKHTNNSRWMHLCHAEVSNRAKIQRAWLRHGFEANLAAQALQQLIIIKIILLQNIIITPANANVNTIVDFLIHLGGQDFDQYVDVVLFWFRLDHLLHDISPLEESRALLFAPRRDLDLSSWDDGTSENYTSFNSSDLHLIYDLFGLEAVANANNGYIRAYTGYNNSRGVACCYLFRPEELFLFMMTRCKKGWTIKDTCNEIFGGNYNRWSYGWRWIMFYLDARYKRTVGHQYLHRVVHRFPEFFDAIQKRVRDAKLHTDTNGNEWRSPGLAFLPYRIFGFIDCSIYKTSIPFSGPDGDYEGAPRKERYAISQRSIYTRFKKVHGIKMETVLLPNGISTIYGPGSARRHDTGGMLRMSGLNDFLVNIQQGRPETTPLYAGLGDCIYGVNLEAIRSYYKAHFTPAQMNQFMRICDAEMRACRQHIEFGYGKIANIFSICADSKNFKLGNHRPYANELLRVCHLLCNIYNCLKGDSSSGYNAFDCPPPSLEDYLQL